MQSSSFTFTSDDGLDVFVRKWMPDASGALRGIVQISHGLAEHGRRYGETAVRLTSAGFAVYVSDHRGHGRSVIESRDFGYFGRTNGWARAVSDLQKLSDLIKEEAGDLPLFLLGHSMGAQLAQQLIMQEGRDFAGVVLSGATGRIGIMRHLSRLLARLERARLSEYGHSKILHAMSFGNFNRDFEPSRTEFDWLSRDEAEVDDYINDPLCGFVATTGLWTDMLGAVSALQRPASYKWTNQDLPILALSGDQDPVSNGGRALKGLARVLRKSGLKNVSLKIYPGGRHEILHETNRADVMTDLIEWLNAIVDGTDKSGERLVLPVSKV
jgi:alpha-beta hydrolase superfamily lysophospholipase